MCNLIQLDKKYKTRNGYSVELEHIHDGEVKYPVRGFIFLSEDNKCFALWTKGGLFYEGFQDKLDLVEVEDE